MKKITCIQNYVIDKLIEDEKLSKKIVYQMQFLKYVRRNSLITYYLFLLKHLFLVQMHLNWSIKKTQKIKQTQ